MGAPEITAAGRMSSSLPSWTFLGTGVYVLFTQSAPQFPIYLPKKHTRSLYRDRGCNRAATPRQSWEPEAVPSSLRRSGIVGGRQKRSLVKP